MHFPDVHPNDIVMYGSGATGGDWRPLVVTRILTKSMPLNNGDGLPVLDGKGRTVFANLPYAVEGIMWAKDGPNVTAYGKDVVYPLGADDLMKDPPRFEHVQHDPRCGVFILSERQLQFEALRQEMLKLKESLDLITA